MIEIFTYLKISKQGKRSEINVSKVEKGILCKL